MTLPGETVGTGAPLPHKGARLQVCVSPAGWYLGYTAADGCPYSRETGYYPTPEAAQAALAGWAFTPRGDASKEAILAAEGAG